MTYLHACLLAFLVSIAIEGLIWTGLWVGCSTTWQNTCEATHVSWGQGLSKHSNCYFHIQHTHTNNMLRLAPYDNLPLYIQ